MPATHPDWTARRDGPGLLRLGIQVPLLVAAVASTVWLAAAGHPAWIAAVIACGLVLTTFFPVLHEAGHGTAFRTRALNETAVWIGAIFNLQAPSFFREFHFEHHRSTQDRENDPEIRPSPALLDDWPGNPATYLMLVSGQHLMLGRFAFTLSCALLPSRVRLGVFPCIRPEKRARVAWESRAVSLVLVTGLAALIVVPPLRPLLLAWPIYHLFLGLYLMPEHTGLPNEGSQIERTRTIRSNALLRWFMWNMPYHAEHHDSPAVPFHALPRLHRELAPKLVHVAPGYLAFHAEAARRSLGLAKG